MTSANTEADLPKFLTIAELVKATQISRQTVSRKLRLNEIPYVKIGARILIPSSFLFDLENAAWSAMGRGGGQA